MPGTIASTPWRTRLFAAGDAALEMHLDALVAGMLAHAEAAPGQLGFIAYAAAHLTDAGLTALDYAYRQIAGHCACTKPAPGWRVCEHYKARDNWSAALWYAQSSLKCYRQMAVEVARSSTGSRRSTLARTLPGSTTPPACATSAPTSSSGRGFRPDCRCPATSRPTHRHLAPDRQRSGARLCAVGRLRRRRQDAVKPTRGSRLPGWPSTGGSGRSSRPARETGAPRTGHQRASRSDRTGSCPVLRRESRRPAAW